MGKHVILFLIGGGIYSLLEIIWRGFTHPSMFIIGGIAFIFIGLINEFFTWDISLLKQCLIASLITTIIEFISGCLVNLLLRWHVWDYSNEFFNLLGQICLKMSIVWYFVSFLGIILDDFLRWILFGEEKPRYKLY